MGLLEPAMRAFTNKERGLYTLSMVFARSVNARKISVKLPVSASNSKHIEHVRRSRTFA